MHVNAIIPLPQEMVVIRIELHLKLPAVCKCHGGQKHSRKKALNRRQHYKATHNKSRESWNHMRSPVLKKNRDHILYHLGVTLKLEILFEYVIVVFPGGKVGSSPPILT